MESERKKLNHRWSQANQGRGSPVTLVKNMKILSIVVIVGLLIAGCSTSHVTVENEGNGEVVLPNNQTRKVIKQEPPEYPAYLRAKRIAGSVVVRLWVRPNGTVAKAEARYSSYPELIPLAVEAVKKWQLEPAKKGDMRVLVLETPITFEIREPETKQKTSLTRSP